VDFCGGFLRPPILDVRLPMETGSYLNRFRAGMVGELTNLKHKRLTCIPGTLATLSLHSLNGNIAAFSTD